MARLVLDNVDKVYDNGFWAVKDLSLDVEDGEFLVLVGPSGCGKTTALRMVAGLEDITDGTVSIGGKVVNDIGPRDRNIAMVFQSYALYPHMTVDENIGFGLALRHEPKATIKEKVARAAGILDLTSMLGRKPKQLSGGQRQRVAIARALIIEPELLLLDEPTSALDVSVQAEILNLLKQLRRDRDLTYLMVSHDLAVVTHLCARVAMMSEGRITEEMSAADVRAGRAQEPYTREFLEASVGYRPIA